MRCRDTWAMMKHPPSSFRIHIPAVIPFLQTACGNLGSLSAPWEAERGVCVCVCLLWDVHGLQALVVMRTFCFMCQTELWCSRVSEHSLSLAHVDEHNAILLHSAALWPHQLCWARHNPQPAYKLIFYSYSGVCFIAPNFGLICCNSESAAFELHQSDRVCEMSAHESCQNYLEQRFQNLFCQPKP